MSTLTAMAKAAVVALALASTMPAQAQGFSFSFGFGNNNDNRFGMICLTESQLRRSIRNRGYSDVRLNVEMNNRIQIRATRDGWIYLLEVNACTGRILDRERLRRA